eukprot:gene61888-84634_t
MPAPLRLRLDGTALSDNWRTLAAMSGRAACGAAIKADGYGLGANEVVRRLAASWWCENAARARSSIRSTRPTSSSSLNGFSMKSIAPFFIVVTAIGTSPWP